MGWEEDVEELLWGALVGLEHASRKGWEVDLWVNFLELKRHGWMNVWLTWIVEIVEAAKGTELWSNVEIEIMSRADQNEPR